MFHKVYHNHMESKDIVIGLLVIIALIALYQCYTKESYGAKARDRLLKKLTGEGMAGNNAYVGTKYDMYQ